MKKNILTALLFVVAILVSMTSCSQIMEELGDEFGDVGGGFGFTSDRSMVRNAKEEHPMEMAEMREDAKTDRVAIDEVEPTEPVEFEEESRYIYSLDGMSDYEIIEYVMPALELAEPFSGTYSACSEWYRESYYALWEEDDKLGDYDNVAELTSYTMESYERTYGKDIYSIYGDYLGDRNLITNGHRMCKSSEFFSHAEVEEYLLNYFSDNYTSDIMEDVRDILFEYDGELYHSFIDSYVGWMSHDVDTAEILGTRSNACKISVTCYSTRGEECQGLFEFIIEDNKLVLDSIEYVF